MKLQARNSNFLGTVEARCKIAAVVRSLPHVSTMIIKNLYSFTSSQTLRLWVLSQIPAREPLIMRKPESERSWTSKVFNTMITLDTYQFSSLKQCLTDLCLTKKWYFHQTFQPNHRWHQLTGLLKVLLFVSNKDNANTDLQMYGL